MSLVLDEWKIKLLKWKYIEFLFRWREKLNYDFFLGKIVELEKYCIDWRNLGLER